jgi:hypothetical protein
MNADFALDSPLRGQAKFGMSRPVRFYNLE